MKTQTLAAFVALTIFFCFPEVKAFPHEHEGILNIDVASEFFYTELKRFFKVIQDPIFKRLGDLLYHHEVDNVRDILTVFASPMTTKIPVSERDVTTTANPITEAPIVENREAKHNDAGEESEKSSEEEGEKSSEES